MAFTKEDRMMSIILWLNALAMILYARPHKRAFDIIPVNAYKGLYRNRIPMVPQFIMEQRPQRVQRDQRSSLFSAFGNIAFYKVQMNRRVWTIRI